jgi:hypothetical protein
MVHNGFHFFVFHQLCISDLMLNLPDPARQEQASPRKNNIEGSEKGEGRNSA